MSEYEALPQEGTVGSLADAGGASLGFLNADSRTGTAANGKLSLTIEQTLLGILGIIDQRLHVSVPPAGLNGPRFLFG